MLHICDICQAAASTLYCHTDSAYLCNTCDEHIHAATSMAFTHDREWVHNMSFSTLAYAPSSNSTCLSFNMLSTENETMAHTTEKVVHENYERESWLFNEHHSNNENQSNGVFANGKQVDGSLGLVEYCNLLQCHQQQQLYGSDHGIVPVQCFDQQVGIQQQQQQQQNQNVHCNSDYEATKAAFINISSSSQSVPMSLVNGGMSTGATVLSNISSSYPNGRADFFPNLSLVLPNLPMNREAKVLRYRQKKKARKFDKKIRYATRKAYAEARPRVKGRFARQTDMEDFELDQLFSTPDEDYGIVPSC